MSPLKAEAPFEHPRHVCDAGGIPRADVLIEGGVARKHLLHRPNARIGIPRRGRNVLAELIEAPLNILNIVVTPEVSHALMSSLKDDAPLNKSCMSVTPDVSQVEMWPYVVSAALRVREPRRDCRF